MKKDISLSVFFPAYNEETNIAEMIENACQVLDDLVSRYEVIVVNDGSKDRTLEIVQAIAATNSNVRYVSHAKNQGYGAAVVSGIRAARYDWVFFTDADLQFDFREIELLLEKTPQYPVVLGYRAPRRDHWLRLLNAKGWNILNRLLFGLKVRDIDCAFKLFKREVIQGVQTRAKGAMLSAEILIRLMRSGYKWTEVPVRHLPRKSGIPTGAKPTVILKAFKEMISLYRGDLGQGTTYVQVFKYGLVGVVNTLVDVLTYIGLTRLTDFFSIHILSAKFVTFCIGTVFSFVLNRRFTFAVKERIKFNEVVRFYSVIVLNVAVNVGLVYVFTSLLGLYDILAVILSTIITFVFGFILSKIWVFKHKTDLSVAPVE